MSWQQVFITLALFGVILVSHFAGPMQGTLVSAAVALLMWLREPPKGGPPQSAVKVAVIFFLIGVLASNAAAAVHL